MLNVENLRDYCLAKPLVTESMPFGAEVLVFKPRLRDRIRSES